MALLCRPHMYALKGGSLGPALARRHKRPQHMPDLQRQALATVQPVRLTPALLRHAVVNTGSPLISVHQFRASTYTRVRVSKFLGARKRSLVLVVALAWIFVVPASAVQSPHVAAEESACSPSRGVYVTAVCGDGPCTAQGFGGRPIPTPARGQRPLPEVCLSVPPAMPDSGTPFTNSSEETPLATLVTLLEESARAPHCPAFFLASTLVEALVEHYTVTKGDGSLRGARPTIALQRLLSDPVPLRPAESAPVLWDQLSCSPALEPWSVSDMPSLIGSLYADRVVPRSCWISDLTTATCEFSPA